MCTFVQTETNPALIAQAFVCELWGDRLQPWDSQLYLRRSKRYFNHSYSTTKNQLLPGIGQMFKGLSSWDCSEERWDLNWSSKFKIESWIVKVHISFQMSVLTRKRDLWWKFRILMCILKIISGLISSGPGDRGKISTALTVDSLIRPRNRHLFPRLFQSPFIKALARVMAMTRAKAFTKGDDLETN